MPVTRVGVIYATVSKLLREIHVPHEDDSELDQYYKTRVLVDGESFASVPVDVYAAGGAQAVQAAVGAPTFSGRCAVVADGVVVDHVVADPALYVSQSGSVVPSDLSEVGDNWDGKVFTRNFAEIDRVTGRVVAQSAQDISAHAPSVDPGNYLVSMPPDEFMVVGAVAFSAQKLDTLAVTKPSPGPAPGPAPGSVSVPPSLG